MSHVSRGHDDYIGRSLALLKPGGRFVEIGKRGIWSHQQMLGQALSPYRLRTYIYGMIYYRSMMLYSGYITGQ